MSDASDCELNANAALIHVFFLDLDDFLVVHPAKADSSDHDTDPTWLLTKHFKMRLTLYIRDHACFYLRRHKDLGALLDKADEKLAVDRRHTLWGVLAMIHQLVHWISQSLQHSLDKLDLQWEARQIYATKAVGSRQSIGPQTENAKREPAPALHTVIQRNEGALKTERLKSTLVSHCGEERYHVLKPKGARVEMQRL